MKTTYKNGTTFEVCNHKEILKKGWKLRSYKFASSKVYEHEDYHNGGVITYMMIENYQGDTLTIIGQSISFLNWYYVAQNPHLWPAGVFLEENINAKTNTQWCIDPCVEGQTPILGHIICKICGHNLRKIK